MNTLSLRRLSATFALCLLLGSTLGCNKMLANFSLKSANKRVEEAKTNQAERFTQDLYQQTTSQVNKAQSLINQQNYAEARPAAKEAADLSKELLERTKNQYANHLREEAFTWIKRAEENQAQQEDADLFNKIKTDNETGQNYVTKQKWDKAITVFTQVISDIDFLLKNLENQAKEGLAQSQKMREELVAEGAPEFAPEYVNKLDQQIAEIQNLIEQEYKYRAALSARDQARQIKQEGVLQTKSVKSEKQLREIENMLEEATNLGAEIFALQNFRVVSKEFDNLLTQFYERNYDTVLTAAPNLQPKVADLIVETKRESARTKMEAVEKAIGTLAEGKARSYLPGRVEQLETLLTEARNLFDQEKFTESKDISLRALELEKTIIGEFDSLAQNEINTASDQLAKAENVFSTMDEQMVFDRQIPGDWAGEALALENSKLAMKEELRTQLTTADYSLNIASLKREEKDFDTAIETAKQVASSAEQVRQQTFRVMAHNAILEISAELTRYEREGGRRYAAAEMDKTLTLLDQSKGLLAQGAYREAVRSAADTKAQLEIMVQELGRVAVSSIENAEKALASAKENRAEEYENTSFTQASIAIDQAKSALAGEGLQQAIESAVNAESLATDASSNALRQWVELQMAQCDQLLDQARRAGADRFAPEQLQAAADMRDNLQALYDQASYFEAVKQGDQAVEGAKDALYAKVNQAENEIAKAKRFEGWEYEPQRLSNAIVSAKNAREMIESGQYGMAEQYAQVAITTARNVTGDAKRKSFDQHLKNLEEHVQNAKVKGAGYYQIGELSQLVGEMNSLRNQFSPDNFEDYASKVSVLEAQLAGLMELTPDVLEKLVISMGDRLAELESRGARTYQPEKVEEIERKIKYAQLDFRNEKYRPSFQNAKDAQGLLDDVSLHLSEREFDAALNGLLEEFTKEITKFGPVLDMGSPSLIRMTTGSNGRSQAISLVQATSPSDLRTNISEIQTKVRSLDAPRTRVELHEGAMKMLELAKTASANFEKMLILDQYDPQESREIIQTAFLQMFQARKLQGDVQHAIQYPQVQFEPVGVERVVSYQGF